MRFSKQISTGLMIESQSGGDPSKPEHLQTLTDNAVNGGIPANDVEVGYCTVEEHEEMLEAKQAAWDIADPMSKWKREMNKFKMSRMMENLITKHFNGVAGDDYDQAEYDKKIKIRGERP